MKDGVPERKANRLATYNYSQSDVYFITICSKNKRCTFGTIVGGGVPDAPRTRLSPTGKIVARQLGNMIAFYPHVRIEKYVVMPNHIHLLIAIQQGPSGASRTPPPTSARASQVIPMLISTLKRLTNKTAGHALWQRGYYDHIIRSRTITTPSGTTSTPTPPNGRRIHVMSRTFLIRCGGPAAAPTKR